MVPVIDGRLAHDHKPHTKHTQTQVLAQLPPMTRTVVRVEEDEKEKGETEGSGGAADGGGGKQAAAAAAAVAEEESPSEQRSENGMDDDEEDEDEEEGEGHDGLPPPHPGPPLCTQDELLAEEREIERELRADESGHACWRDQEGRMIKVIDYRLLGLRKAKAVCEWLAGKLQVRLDLVDVCLHV